MKPTAQYLPPRQTIVYGYTRKMLDETATNANTFAMVVAELYLGMTAPDVRQVKFRLGEGDELIRALRNNGQILRRYMDGTLKVLPSDLEDAWVMALPQPYRDDCERDLARRRGQLPVPMPHGDECAIASMAKLYKEFGHLMEALAPAMSDNVIDGADAQYAKQICDEADDVIAAVMAIRKPAMQLLVSGGKP